MEFKPAQCPTCGGSLQVPENRTSVRCMYCGGAVVVREAINAAMSASVPNLLKLATAAAQSQNHKEAYDYFTRVLELDSTNSEAWAGKASAAGRLSNGQSFRIPEMINYYARSLEVVADDGRANAEESAGNSISQIITQYYNRLRSDLSPAFADGQTWLIYLNGLNDILEAIHTAHRLLPRSVAILQTGIYICSDNAGYLRYANKYNGQVSRRPLPPEMAAVVEARKQTYTHALSSVAPRVTPVSIENDYRPGLFEQMTPARWVLIIVLMLFIIGMVSSALEK